MTVKASGGCVLQLFTSLLCDVVTTPCQNPIRALKWVGPLFWCFCCFCFQSVMLHQATIQYVNEPRHDVLVDVGHEILGHKQVKMTVLDMISGSAMASFFVACALFRCLRLWVKVFMCCGFLFFCKGFLDYITVLHDSSSWENCKHRLDPINGTNTTLVFFQGFDGLSGVDYWTRIMELEFMGVAGKWPVRYCADMILSGHTFVMLLFLLGCADLVRRVHATFKDVPGMACIEVLVNIIIAGCVCADLYLIVVNHFHYTVDVILAIIMTLLFYTNAGVTILADWWVELWEADADNERYTKEETGSVWVPPILVPCCCFQGYYHISEKTEDEVAQAFEDNLPDEVKMEGDSNLDLDEDETDQAEDMDFV